MKSIIQSLCFSAFLLGSGVVTAQSVETDENGRTAADLARRTSVEQPAETSNARNGDPENVGPGEDKDVGVYPVPGSSEGGTIFNNVAEVTAQLDDLLQQVEKLQLSDLEQQQDLANIKKSLEMCCGGGASLDDESETAHLLQNAPNPFISDTDIQYFLPSWTGRASLQIRDLNGAVLQTYPLPDNGIGKVRVQNQHLLPGTYIYTLEVDGQVVDARLMVVAQ